MLTTRHCYLDTAPRIRARDCQLGLTEWLGIGLQVSERQYGVRRHRRLVCPVCNNPNQAILYALPNPVCKRCAQASGYMYSYQSRSPKRELAKVLHNKVGRQSTPTAKRLALMRALEAQALAMELDLTRLASISKRTSKP